MLADTARSTRRREALPKGLLLGHERITYPLSPLSPCLELFAPFELRKHTLLLCSYQIPDLISISINANKVLGPRNSPQQLQHPNV